MLSIFRPRRKATKLPSTDLIPRGLSRTIIPIEYVNSVGHNWDENNPLYTNKILLDSRDAITKPANQ